MTDSKRRDVALVVSALLVAGGIAFAGMSQRYRVLLEWPMAVRTDGLTGRAVICMVQREETTGALSFACPDDDLRDMAISEDLRALAESALRTTKPASAGADSIGGKRD